MGLSRSLVFSFLVNWAAPSAPWRTPPRLLFALCRVLSCCCEALADCDLGGGEGDRNRAFGVFPSLGFCGFLWVSVRGSEFGTRRKMQSPAMEDFSLQALRNSANAALSQYEPVVLVLASVITWIVLSVTSSVLSGAYICVSEKGKLGLLLMWW